MADDKNPVYRFWNGKNINGASVVGDTNLIEQASRNNVNGEQYAVSVDTFSADDLQPDVSYDDI
jgi:hypothetical protein